MPKLNIKKQTTTSADEAFKLVKNFLEHDKSLKKLDPSYSCTFNDPSLSGTAAGKLFSARMAVKKNDSGSEVEIVVELPMILALSKGLVEKTLRKMLDESLA